MENGKYLLLKKQKEKIKKKLSGIIFARSFCSLGIIIFHYFCHSKGKFKTLLSTANASWGLMFVTSFFSISGTVLYYNYSKISSLKTFYFKRWKSIFPAYYICFLYFFLKNVFRYHKLFYRGHWLNLFLTVFGLDGYLKYRFKSYYLIGEWFLGAIIIIYSIYPILLFLMNKNILIIHFIISCFYPFIHLTNFFIIKDTFNIISCIYSFYFGMLCIKFYLLFFKNRITLIISFLILLFLCLVKMSKFLLILQIQGFSLYIVLTQIGELIMLSRFRIIFIKISNLSYYIFLFHHKIILDILGVMNPTEWYLHFILLAIVIILTIICSKILLIIMTDIFKSNIFKKLEKFFL